MQCFWFMFDNGVIIYFSVVWVFTDIMFFIGPIDTDSGSLSKSFMENIQQEYRLKKNTVTLIGKDGGIKSQKKSVDLQILFSTIDAMPMRQQEMHLK
ncbi:DUF4174 domain-containing protein [Psychromonas sp. RZ5]|nr:DUF4174 domain-containing protein [Psychromonas sp. RZ5]